jgi:hypothetical protein
MPDILLETLHPFSKARVHPIFWELQSIILHLYSNNFLLAGPSKTPDSAGAIVWPLFTTVHNSAERETHNYLVSRLCLDLNPSSHSSFTTTLSFILSATICYATLVLSYTGGKHCQTLNSA